jgi:hypothetical protein
MPMNTDRGSYTRGLFISFWANAGHWISASAGFGSRTNSFSGYFGQQ